MIGLSSCSSRSPHEPPDRRCGGGIGGFAGLFALQGGYREPVLASSTDGVGTKLAVAQAMDKHDTVGLDLVAMVVDDLVVCGAEPLFLQDYIAVGRTIAGAGGRDRVRCRRRLCDRWVCAAGGETAEHPWLMEPDDYDISATGLVLSRPTTFSARNVFGRVT